jgi:ribosomal protein S12 methylthiotransferase accessory factor
VSDASQPHIVFLGPSLPVERAKQLLPNGDFRPPIKRGDLDDIVPGALVAIIDGFFAQTLAISPGEIREAIENGITIYGAASMGALRAAEVPSVVGVGRIYEMYRSGVIDRDDEVALLIDPRDNSAITEPLVNVRFSVERLVRSGTISRRDGESIVSAAEALHFSERSYEAILAKSTLAGNKDVADVIRLLKRFDLKRDDAHLLLETIAVANVTAKTAKPTAFYLRQRASGHARVNLREAADAPLLVWETGDSVGFDDLVLFLKITGAYEALARRAILRISAGGSQMKVAREAADGAPEVNDAQQMLDMTRTHWGWETPEEAHVTMRDLGLGLDDVADSLDAEIVIRRLIEAFALRPQEHFSKALRHEMWLDELGLKREVIRLGALLYFAEQSPDASPLTEAELLEAKRTIARLRSSFRWQTVVIALERIGVTAAQRDRMIATIALARRCASPIVEMLERAPATRQSPVAYADKWRNCGLMVESSPKAAGSARFSLSEAEAKERAEAIAARMGVVRIGLVGELDTLGIHIAQAFADRGGWSSSFSSGKSETREGARIGAIMEEVEIHAQDAYQPKERVSGSFETLSRTLRIVDPRDLGLPFDSGFRLDLSIDWSPCFDLASRETVYAPTAALVSDRLNNDPFYCPRLGGKIFSTSGLGSGFTLAEAIVHASAEYIERHAYRLAEIQLDNPGGVEGRSFYFVDERTLPEAPARILARYQNAGMFVRILDITSEVAVPTFFVRVYEDLLFGGQSVSSDGFACHPDPEVAITMALLEAAQTRGGYIAGGREDYSLHARSLGRHERPRTAVPRWQAFWFANDRPVRPFRRGFQTDDILHELEWMVDRVVEAGVPAFLVADYTMERIATAHAVRVLLPGLETTNPLYTGPRARAAMIRNMLPRGSYAN